MSTQEDVLSDPNFGILKKYFEEVITPNFQISGGSSGYSKDFISGDSMGYIQLPRSFISYKDSDYYYKEDGDRFIHFTSLNTLAHIINNGYFLASQLTSLDDPLELIYAGRELSKVVTKEKIEQLKGLLFSLSMCRYENGADSFDMWRLYGDNGNGIGIVGSFYPNKHLWHDSYLSSVYYGNASKYVEKFRKFSEDHVNFINANPNMKMQSNVVGELGISESIALFLAFHKNSLFKIENEIRFLKSFLCDRFKCSSENDSIDILFDKNHIAHYGYKIPIVSEKNMALLACEKNLHKIKNFTTEVISNINSIEDYINDQPFIMIEKVILGYRYTEKDLNKLKQNEDKINSKLKSRSVHFELSSLSQDFNR